MPLRNFGTKSIGFLLGTEPKTLQKPQIKSEISREIFGIKIEKINWTQGPRIRQVEWNFNLGLQEGRKKMFFIFIVKSKLHYWSQKVSIAILIIIWGFCNFFGACYK